MMIEKCNSSPSIAELTSRVKLAASSRSHEERIQLLKKAHILDSNGNLDQRLMSKKPEILNV